MVDVGQKCKGIVFTKDESSKEIWIHLTKIVLGEPESKYMSFIGSNSRSKENEEIFIHRLNQYAFMKDYDIVIIHQIFKEVTVLHIYLY